MTKYIEDGSLKEVFFSTFREAGDLFWELMYGPKNRIAIGVFSEYSGSYHKVCDADLLYWHEIKVPEFSK